MPVKYIVVPHKIPSKPDQPLVYYPRVKSSGEVSLREIANDIAAESTFSQADTMGVIESFLQSIPRYLADGMIVRLGELGSFYLSVQAEGASEPEKVNVSKIKGNRLRFRAGKLIKKMLKSIEYEKG